MIEIFNTDSTILTTKELTCSPRALSMDDITMFKYMKGHTYDINFIIMPTWWSL